MQIFNICKFPRVSRFKDYHHLKLLIFLSLYDTLEKYQVGDRRVKKKNNNKRSDMDVVNTIFVNIPSPGDTQKALVKATHTIYTLHKYLKLPRQRNTTFETF